MSYLSNVFFEIEDKLLITEPFEIAEAILRVDFTSLADDNPYDNGKTPVIRPSGNFLDANFKPLIFEFQFLKRCNKIDLIKITP